MERTIEIVLRKGETLESAVGRFKRKVAAITKESFYLKPGEKKRVSQAPAPKRNRKKAFERSPLFAAAVEHVGELPAVRQDQIAKTILEELQVEADPRAKLFQELVEVKYTRGLTLKEKRQMQDLETKLDASDEAFYRPILDRQRTRLPEKKSRSTS